MSGQTSVPDAGLLALVSLSLVLVAIWCFLGVITRLRFECAGNTVTGQHHFEGT